MFNDFNERLSAEALLSVFEICEEQQGLHIGMKY